MNCYVKTPTEVPKISTPNSLVFHSATASAVHIVSYCLPVLHEYFMARELDSSYKRFMTRRRRLLEIGFYMPRFLVSKTTKRLASHLIALRDYYWSSRVLCNKRYKFIRSMISQEINTVLNSGLNYTHVMPLCKLVIQLLFCYDVGDFASELIEIIKLPECQELEHLLKALTPFHVEFLDARSLVFGDTSVIRTILSSSPNLEKIFVREVCFRREGMDLLPKICGRNLREIGINREGSFSSRYDLSQLFFKGKSKDEVIEAAHKNESLEVSFPGLSRVYVSCSLEFECFHIIKFALRKFQPRVVFTSSHESTYHMTCDFPCCQDELQQKFDLAMVSNFPSLIEAHPEFSVFTKKFINFDENCEITHLELSSTAIWLFGSRINVYLALCFSHFNGLKLLLSPDATRLYGNPPAPGQSYSILFREAGKALLMLSIQVSTTEDLAEALHCLNYCPVLREFSLRLEEAWIVNIRPLLRMSLKPLRELTKIEFCGTLDRDSHSVAHILEKVILAAPNLQYILFSEDMVNEINLLSSACFLSIRTLHIKQHNISKTHAEALKTLLKQSSSVQELVLEKVGKRTKWAKQLDQTTALSVRCVPSCKFLEVNQEIEHMKRNSSP